MTDMQRPHTPTRRRSPNKPAKTGTVTFVLNGERQTRSWTDTRQRLEIVIEMTKAGMSLKVIGGLMGIAPSAVQSALSRAGLTARTMRPTHPTCSHGRASVSLETYALVSRYAARNGRFFNAALHELVEAGAKALNFNPDTTEKTDE